MSENTCRKDHTRRLTPSRKNHTEYYLLLSSDKDRISATCTTADGVPTAKYSAAYNHALTENENWKTALQQLSAQQTRIEKTARSARKTVLCGIGVITGLSAETTSVSTNSLLTAARNEGWSLSEPTIVSVSAENLILQAADDGQAVIYLRFGLSCRAILIQDHRKVDSLLLSEHPYEPFLFDTPTSAMEKIVPLLRLLNVRTIIAESDIDTPEKIRTDLLQTLRNASLPTARIPQIHVPDPLSLAESTLLQQLKQAHRPANKKRKRTPKQPQTIEK